MKDEHLVCVKLLLIAALLPSPGQRFDTSDKTILFRSSYCNALGAVHSSTILMQRSELILSREHALEEGLAIMRREQYRIGRYFEVAAKLLSKAKDMSSTRFNRIPYNTALFFHQHLLVPPPP